MTHVCLQCRQGLVSRIRLAAGTRAASRVVVPCASEILIEYGLKLIVESRWKGREKEKSIQEVRNFYLKNENLYCINVSYICKLTKSNSTTKL